MYYLNYFFLYSILGHLMESTLYPSFNSGILYGYWTPIYGLGILFIILIDRLITDKLKLDKFKRLIALFLISAVSLMIIEYFGGIIIQNVFNRIFWNYDHHNYNFGLYTSIEMGLIWGCASILVVYVLKPLTDKFIDKIPKIITYILIGLMIVDALLTINKML